MAKSVIIVSCPPWCSCIHQQHNTFGDKRLTQNGPRKELAVELLRAQVEARGAEKARQVAINAARNG